MVNADTSLPADMLRFIDTPVAQPFAKGRNMALIGSTVFALVLFFSVNLHSTLLAGLFAVATLSFSMAPWFGFAYQSHASYATGGEPESPVHGH